MNSDSSPPPKVVVVVLFVSCLVSLFSNLFWLSLSPTQCVVTVVFVLFIYLVFVLKSGILRSAPHLHNLIVSRGLERGGTQAE